MTTSDPGPPGTGTTLIALVASFFVPLVGLILFFMWRTNPITEYRTLGRNALIAALVGIGLGCLCYLIAFGGAMVASLSTSGM